MAGIIQIGSAEAEKRRKAVSGAQAFLDRELGRRWAGRKAALDAVSAHARPMARARQIVDFERRQRLFGHEPRPQVSSPVKSKIRRSKHRLAQMVAAGEDPETADGCAVRYCWPRAHRDPLPLTADLSDVQELLARVIDSGVRDPLHYTMIRKLARRVADGLSRADFEAQAATIALLPSAIPAKLAEAVAPGCFGAGAASLPTPRSPC